MVSSDVVDALERKIKAEWGLLVDGTTAVIEVASAAGLSSLRPDERNPMVATSYGVGQLISAALDGGCRRIILGLGGSATVDGGSGLLEALGARFLDSNGASIPRGGQGLAMLEHIDVAGLDPRLADTEIVAACDVDNELLGERGSARTFGPQKGATPDMVRALDENLARFAEIIRRDRGRDVRRLERGGAAGGMGAGIAGILGARLAGGIDLVLEHLHFDEQLAGCDLVVTAEGLLDRQTLFNKAPYGVAVAARRRSIPVVIVVGGESDEARGPEFSIFDAIVPICPRPMPLEEAMAQTHDLVARASERLFRLLRLGASLKTDLEPE
jgi:glycerate kinase